MYTDAHHTGITAIDSSLQNNNNWLENGRTKQLREICIKIKLSFSFSMLFYVLSFFNQFPFVHTSFKNPVKKLVS